MATTLEISTYLDGENEPEGYREVVNSFRNVWNNSYANGTTLSFAPPMNLKQAAERALLPAQLKRISNIRNPDFFFAVPSYSIELGGVEITGHSPDGSNVEKRYPFLWASRRGPTDAFIASYYLKKRPGGQINRLPYRHAHRNGQFLDEWTPQRLSGRPLCQIVPVRELHLSDIKLVPKDIRDLMLSWADLGSFFAHSLAARILKGRNGELARTALEQFKIRLMKLAVACMGNTRDTDASSLIKAEKKWIQIYNTRPDSGHWERGEGQFDSIDGRLMFTLDEIDTMTNPPRSFEFWLPQMVSTHPWISEQRSRGFTSKRLRNIMVVLADSCTTRFADQLTLADWNLLQRNSRLLLERLDWRREVYRVRDLVPPGREREIARSGIARAPVATLEAIEELLRSKNLYFSADRPYNPGYASRLSDSLALLPAKSTVLIPRIPRGMLSEVRASDTICVLAAEDMTKGHLLMLRQLHRQGVPRGDGTE